MALNHSNPCGGMRAKQVGLEFVATDSSSVLGSPYHDCVDRITIRNNISQRGIVYQVPRPSRNHVPTSCSTIFCLGPSSSHVKR